MDNRLLRDTNQIVESAVLIIVRRDWIAVSAASPCPVLHQSRMPRPGTFLVGGYRFRRRLSPFARKLGRNSKNAKFEKRSYHGNLSRLTLETQIRSIPAGRRKRIRPIQWARNVCPFARREQTLRPRRPGQLSRFLASRQSILRNLIARVPITDKYCPGCRTRLVIRCVSSRENEKFDRAACPIEIINLARSVRVYSATTSTLDISKALCLYRFLIFHLSATWMLFLRLGICSIILAFICKNIKLSLHVVE